MANGGSDIVRTRLWPAGELAQNYFSVRDVLNDAGLDAIQANEAKPAHDLFATEQLRELLFISEAVLERYDGCSLIDQRRQQLGELSVGRRFQADKHDVADAYLSGRARAFRVDVKIALRAVDEDTVAPHDIVITSKEEMNFMTVAAELRSVITAQCTATDDSNLHFTPKLILIAPPTRFTMDTSWQPIRRIASAT